MSALNQNTAECESVVRRLLEMNMVTTQIMSSINNNSDVHIQNKPRHISLIEHANNFQLLPPEIVKYVLDIEKNTNIQFIKQRSPEWFQIRKQARITGSTLNSGIGLDTLQKQKQHFYFHVRGRQPAPVSEELQTKFDHGAKNEVNGTATLITTVVPAYLPACFAFYEVGPAFIGCENQPKLLEVSADGILQCSSGGETCPNYSIHGDRRIVIEIKSPTPQDNVAETLFYKVRNRYFPQLQSELKSYNCTELWLLCSTAISATVIIVLFDEHIWNRIWDLTCALCEPNNPNIPTRLHADVKQLKIDISAWKQQCSRFLCEVPTVTGEYGNITVDPNFSSPYSPAPPRIQIDTTTESVSNMSKELSFSAISAFQECHQVLREPAKELLVFMLTDKDRKQNKNVPYSFPVAYALKGSSMSNTHLQFLVDKIRNELWSRNIPVLCETYDGQWHKHITKTRSGHRLTKFHGKELWNKLSNLSKDKCLEQIHQMSVVKKSSHELIHNCSLSTGKGILFLGIRIEKGEDSKLFISSEQLRMQHVHSIHPLSRPDLFNEVEVADQHEEFPKHYRCMNKEGNAKEFQFVSVFMSERSDKGSCDKTKQKSTKHIGLYDTESSLLDILKPMYIANLDLENANVDVLTPDEEIITLEHVLKNTDCPLLPNILNELVNTNTQKWNGKNCDDLFPSILSDGRCLSRNATVKELQIICGEIRCCTGRVWYTSNMNKSEIVNSVVKAFSGNTFVEKEKSKCKKRTYNVETLVQA